MQFWTRIDANVIAPVYNVSVGHDGAIQSRNYAYQDRKFTRSLEVYIDIFSSAA